MKRTIIRSIVVSAVLIASAAAVFAESLPASKTTALVAIVPSQARIELNAAGQIVKIFNTTDGAAVRPSILNVYREGAKSVMTPQISQELDKISSKIDWRMGGVVYDTPGK